jgi:fumarylacetoacetase
MASMDDTHDPARRSWVASANGHADFPIQNLPLGVFTPLEGGPPRGGVAIGNEILDLQAAVEAGVFQHEDGAAAARLAAQPTLNAFFAAGPAARRRLRADLSAMLRDGAAEASRLQSALYAADACTLHLPATIGDYTDFYAGIHHATNVGALFRPDQPLLPNYKHVPIGYHGRSSSIVVSGTAVRRPLGQRKDAADGAPVFGPSRRLDFELELGLWIGPGNELGEPIPIAAAADQIAGFCLLNDWSARDIQAWEYQPLGPFLAKNFATSISPWVVTPEALAPFRLAPAERPAGDPTPLPYLLDAGEQAEGALDIQLTVSLHSACLRARGLSPHPLSISNARHLYWTVAQLVTHHASNGCNLCPGDLLGTGTISGPAPGTLGSLLEIAEGGKAPITLASEGTRTFLEDGDEVIMTARAQRDGYASIGFGEVRGTVLPALG